MEQQNPANQELFSLEEILQAYEGCAPEAEAESPAANAAPAADVPPREAEEIPAEGFRFGDEEAADRMADEISLSVFGEETVPPREENPARKLLDRLRSKIRPARETAEEAEEPEEEPAHEEPEPDARRLLRRLSFGLQGKAVRSWCALGLSVFLVIFSLAADAERSLPFGIGHSLTVAAGTAGLIQVLVLLLSTETVLDGVLALLHGKPSAETVAVLANLLTVFQAIHTAKGKADTAVLPLCAVAAFAAASCQRGSVLIEQSMVRLLHAAGKTGSQDAIGCAYSDIRKASLIRRSASGTTGFYRNLLRQDASDQLFSMVCTPALCAVFFLALVAAAVNRFSGFFPCLSALICACCSFSALYAYGGAMKRVANGAAVSGAIVAGWGGASDLSGGDALVVEDRDLFPAGCVSFNGYRVLDTFDRKEAVACAASVMSAGKSGLSALFEDLAQSENISVPECTDFESFEGGGVGGMVGSRRVYCGSAAFMSLRGIRLPDHVNLKSGVFTVIDGRLAAVFAVNYTPVKPVQGALMTVLRMKVRMLFAMRDFNLTPALLHQRYNVELEGAVFLSDKESMRVTSNENGQAPTAAILTREGLPAVSEAMLRGRHLVFVCRLASILAAVGAAAGVIFAFILLVSGGPFAVRTGNLFFYMLAVHAAVLALACSPCRPH